MSENPTSETTVTRVLARDIEAVMMVLDEPMSVIALASALEAPISAVAEALSDLAADYDGRLGGVERGFELREVSAGWRLYVRPRFDEVVTRVVSSQAPAKLSQAALETLAVIAYKQPVTRGHVSAIRAVNVDSVIRTLLSRGLIRESHADSETGAIFYVTTETLLGELGLESIDQLPPLSPLLDDGAGGFDDVE
jgi:segregation and condensation protein B